MAKLTLSDLAGGYLSPALVNANNALIEAALENTLSRDGTSPNAMGTTLDMNSFRIINVGEPVASSDAVRLSDLQGATVNNPIPSQSGNNRKYLQTNGSTLSWQFLENINVKDFGAVGDGSTDDTAAIQLALDELDGSFTAVNANIANKAIYFPAGVYRVTSTLLPPEEASYYVMYGDSARSSEISWDGAAGQPVMKHRNIRKVTMRDLSVNGKSSAKPSYLIQIHRDSAYSDTAGTLGFTAERLSLGDGTGCHTTSVAFTADVGEDTNNEQAMFYCCEFNGPASYGVHFSHSNSLLHSFVHCGFGNYGIAAVNNVMAGSDYHASFSMWGCTFSGNEDSTILHLGQPRFAINLYNCYHENEGTDNTKVLTQSAAWTEAGIVNFWGCQFAMGDPDVGQYTIEFDAATKFSHLNFSDTFVYSPNGITLNLLGGMVCFNGGGLTSADIRYEDAEVWLRNCKQGAGALAITKVGGGTGFVDATDRSAGASQLNIVPIITTGTSLSVSGRSQNILELNYAAPENIDTLTDGYVGQEVTLFAVSGNATIVHTAAGTADKLYLRDAVNWTMQLGESITFRRMDATAGSNRWIEVSRNQRVLMGSATYDPANLVDAAGATTTVTVTGAALGDYARASFSLDLQGITLTAWVSSANTVSVRFQNETGGALDLASGTLRACVEKA